MLLTFCDRCKKEIRRKKGGLVKHEIELTRIEEDDDGDQSSTVTMKLEVCSGCRVHIGDLLTRLLKT